MTYRTTLPALAAILLTGCASVASLPTERVGEARLAFANGLPAGTVQLLSNGQRVTVAVAAVGLPSGDHGFHLHMAGRCEAPGFTTAGGHLNPGRAKHGSLAPGGSHLGDMPNLAVGANRTGTAEVELPGDARVVLEAIFDADGTAVVIHEGPDDYTSDPAGNAGPRIACGVLKQL